MLGLVFCVRGSCTGREISDAFGIWKSFIGFDIFHCCSKYLFHHIVISSDFYIICLKTSGGPSHS